MVFMNMQGQVILASITMLKSMPALKRVHHSLQVQVLESACSACPKKAEV